MSKNIIEKDLEETTMEDASYLGYDEFKDIKFSNDDDDDYDDDDYDDDDDDYDSDDDDFDDDEEDD